MTTLNYTNLRGSTKGLRPPQERGEPVGPDIRSWVVLLARMAGWRPKKHRELPGNEVLWRTFKQLQAMVRYRQSQRGLRTNQVPRTHPPHPLALGPVIGLRQLRQETGSLWDIAQ